MINKILKLLGLKKEIADKYEFKIINGAAWQMDEKIQQAQLDNWIIAGDMCLHQSTGSDKHNIYANQPMKRKQ